MDDAALSVGGTMWLRRNQCEFILMTVGGVSNFTKYYFLDREYFDVEVISDLRRAESEMFMRLLGGRHVALEQVDAPLRYHQDRWTLDWFRRHRESVNSFVWHCAGPLEHQEWAATIAEALATLQPQEIWIPLGVGPHIDHELTRNACLQMVIGNAGLLQQSVIKLYQDVPYAASFPSHTANLVGALTDGGATLEEKVVDISEVLAKKLHLSSIFGSQFEMDLMGPRIEECARRAGVKVSGYGEIFYRLLAPPTTELDPLSCYAERDTVLALAKKTVPWFCRNHSTSLIRFLMPAPAGRWEEDVNFLLDLFPRAVLEMHLARTYLAETEALTSPRVVIRPVNPRIPWWCTDAIRSALGRRSPVVILTGRPMEHYARWLGFLCLGSDSIIALTMNHFILALRLARTSTGEGETWMTGSRTFNDK